MLLFTACLPVLANDQARTLETLLKELRETRQATAEEKRLTAEEERRGKQLLAQRKARLAEIKKKTETADKELFEQMSATAKLSDQHKKLATLAKELYESRRKQAKAILDLLEQHPLLLRPEEQKRLAAVAEGKLVADAAGANLWNSLLALSVAAVETELTTTKITVGTEELTATVLRLGGVGAVWITEDGSRGGTADASSGKLVWSESKAKDLSKIADAIKVIRREVPAKLVALPLGKGGGQ